MPKLSVDHAEYSSFVDKLLGVHLASTTLPANYQKLIGEIILLQAFSQFEQCLESVATKVQCSARYLDGTAPMVLKKAKSAVDARRNMMQHGRKKVRSNLKWTIPTEIKKNVQFVLDPADHYIDTIDKHGDVIDEMRKIRNRIAHNSDSARKRFREIVKLRYGAVPNSVTPGNLLLSSRFSPIVLIELLNKSKTMVTVLTKS